ncbi:uncharacterized protein [Mytilus edulis]|uniref:uncharacterized protein n=1 Tax=Mytilus edulis TaxID=6550 RepID=UPI0039F13460
MGNNANHCGCHTIEANDDEHETNEENDENRKLTVAEMRDTFELDDKKAPAKPAKIDSNRPSKSVCEIERKYILLAGAILAVIFLSLIVGILYLTIELDPKNDNCKLNELNHGELFSGHENDPFFGTVFPKKGSPLYIKCFLPFKGDYTIETIFEGENKGSNVTKICPTGKNHIIISYIVIVITKQVVILLSVVENVTSSELVFRKCT